MERLAELVVALELGQVALLARCEGLLVLAQMPGVDSPIGCSDWSSAPEGFRSSAAKVKDRGRYGKSRLFARHDSQLILTISGSLCMICLVD